MNIALCKNATKKLFPKNRYLQKTEIFKYLSFIGRNSRFSNNFRDILRNKIFEIAHELNLLALFVSAGDPPPQVLWKKDRLVLDTTFNILPNRQGETSPNSVGSAICPG